MGAGSFPAGIGPAGADPVYVPAYAAPPKLARAMYFDPSTRRFKQNADGSIADVHPVDQQVAILLFMEQGAVPSTATIGTRLRRRLTRLDPRKVQSTALDEVRRTLKSLIDAGDILLLSVVVDTSVPGRKSIAVTYVNMRDPNTNPLQPTSNATTVVG